MVTGVTYVNNAEHSVDNNYYYNSISKGGQDTILHMHTLLVSSPGRPHTLSCPHLSEPSTASPK